MIGRVRIRDRWIGEGEPCFIIAEVGSNHDGKLSQGKDLIDVAAEAKVDAIKFQSFTAETWVSKDGISASGAKGWGDLKEELRKYELPYDMFRELKAYAESNGLLCLSSPSHVTDVVKLEEAGVAAYKFGSVQITDTPTIRYAAAKGKPMLVSTGGSTLAEIEGALQSIYSTGNRDVILFHCTVMYPAEMGLVNLTAMDTIRSAFRVPVGYSDHTLDPVIIPVAAVARGAVAFEKHFSLSRALPGPDHPFALEPGELKAMVKAIRSIEQAFGEAQKRLTEAEQSLVRMGRRSLVARVSIRKGDIIREEMLTTKRPGLGIPPRCLDVIVGRVARRDIGEDELLRWEDV
ncbi:MAG: N-acetylneuraminate synthase [Chloroflexi bacterium]|nr:N-acetylneuraminate synthase [Chloroflexota bacterium]